MTPNILLQFINAKGNILLALSSSNPTPTSLVSLLAELDIQLPADRTGLVVDHFNYDSASASDLHDVLVLPPPGPIRPDVKDFFGGASASSGALLAFPRGVGATLGPGPLLTPVVRAPATAYSYNPKEQGEALDEVFAAGEQLSLVSAVQARNSARLALVGSAEMLQDKWFDAKVRRAGDKADSPTGNREFAKTVAGWAFKEIGVLKVNWVEHRLDEEAAETNPKIYRIKNDVVGGNISYLHPPLFFDNNMNRLAKHNYPFQGLHHLPLRVVLGQVDRLQRPRQRRPPARVLHALALPPRAARRRRVPLGPQVGGGRLLGVAPAAGPARHLQLRRQLQAALPHGRRGEAHRLGPPHGPRRVAAQLRHQRRVAVARGHRRHRRRLAGVCGRVDVQQARGGAEGYQEDAVKGGGERKECGGDRGR